MVTHICGLTALAPLGSSSTLPVLPSESVVLRIRAPPLSVQPLPEKSSGVSPGAIA